MGWARAIDGALRSLARVWRFRTTPRRRPRHKPPSRRRLLFEMLEPRLLLSASPTSVASVTGGVLVANLTEGADSVVFEKIGGDADVGYSINVALGSYDAETYTAVRSIIADGLGGNDKFLLVGLPSDLPVTLSGGAGDDTYSFAQGTGGTVTLTDASGTDTLDFTGMSTGVTVDLSSGAAQTVAPGLTLQLSTPSAFENLSGGRGDDVLTGNAGNNVIIGGPGSDVLTGGGGTDKIVDIDRPLVLLPGIGASYPIDDITVVNAWFDHRGVLPEQLEIDPLAKVYADMIQTLKNVGYVEGETLFLAPWDFRLSVAPRPTDATYDGHIDGLSAENLTDGTYQYAVDYFGHAMDRAVNAWKSEYGVAPVDIDVLTHSTGGLIARSYIQSDAYNTALPDGDLLPKVHDLVQAGVPERGSTSVWNAMHNNWVDDLTMRFFSKIVERAWNDMLAGTPITGADYDITLTSPSVLTNGVPDPVKFVRLYANTLYDLLPTFDFIQAGNQLVDSNDLDINDDGVINSQDSVLAQSFIDENGDGTSDFVNRFLLDLNAGLDADFTLAALQASATHTVTVNGQVRNPNAFLGQMTGELTVIYGADQASGTSVSAHQGDPSPLPGFEIVDLTNFFGRSPHTTEQWWKEVETDGTGDQAVLTESTLGQFQTADGGFISKVQAPDMEAQPGEKLNHRGLIETVTGESTILNALGVPYLTSQISTGLVASTVDSLKNVVARGIFSISDLRDDVQNAGSDLLGSLKSSLSNPHQTLHDIGVGIGLLDVADIVGGIVLHDGHDVYVIGTNSGSDFQLAFDASLGKMTVQDLLAIPGGLFASPTAFDTPTDSIHVELNGGIDNFGLQSLDPAFHGKLVVDDDILTVRTNLTSPVDLELTADVAIVVNDNRFISTREIPGGNVMTALSSGDSHSITLRAPLIALGAGAKLLAQATSGYAAGDITLEATDLTGKETPFISLQDAEAGIALAGATIKGGAIDIKATAGSKRLFGDTGTATDKVLDFMQSNSPFKVGVAWSEADATVTVSAGTLIEGASVSISADARTEAKIKTFNKVLALA